MQTNTKISPYYESIEFNLATATTDYDLDAQQSGFLSVFGPGNIHEVFPTQVQIRTDQTISIKLNSTSNQSITIAATDSPFTIKGIEIVNLFISNASGSTAAIKLFFQDVE